MNRISPEDQEYLTQLIGSDDQEKINEAHNGFMRMAGIIFRILTRIHKEETGLSNEDDPIV